MLIQRNTSKYTWQNYRRRKNLTKFFVVKTNYLFLSLMFAWIKKTFFMTSHSDESTFRRRLYISIMLRSKGFATYFKIRTLFYCSKWWTMNFWYQRKYRFSLEKIFFYLCTDQGVVPLIELIIRHLLSITLSPCPRVVFVLCEEWGEAGERWGPGLAMCSVCLSPPDAPHTSHLTPHTSHLTPYTSHLTPHTPHLTPHTSHLTPHNVMKLAY